MRRLPEVVTQSYRLLEGFFSVYKPPGLGVDRVEKRLKKHICADLNEEAKLIPPKLYLDIDRTKSDISINVRPSYASNSLCSGPNYDFRHIDLQLINPLNELASGVLIVSVNVGENIPKIMKSLNFTKCYHIKGILGQTTSNFHIDGRVLAKARYEGVHRNKFEKVLANYQSATQRRIYEEYGFSLKSQKAYEFAVKGLYRPSFKGPPIIYSLKTVDFDPPNFTIEVQCSNETKELLLHLIHNLGLNLKSYATCAEMICIRHGCFYAEHALVRQEWYLKNILKNIELSKDILIKHYETDVTFSPTVTTSKEQKEEDFLRSISNSK